MKEDKIITSLKESFPDLGDDAAIFGNHIISKDILVEDVHFRRRYFDPKDLAHKAIHVNLSDIAAMGGKPLYILLGLSIPKGYSEYVEEFLSAFTQICLDNKISLIGGDTTSSTDKLFISVTIIGTTDNPITRNTANIDDVVFIVGNIGNACVGLTALENDIEGLDRFKDNLLRPEAKVEEGLWLNSLKKITSMMDVSDGLMIDLKKIGKILVKTESFTATTGFTEACNLLNLDPISVMLTGGEDYSLLLTVNPEYSKKLEKDFKDKFGYPLKLIGQVIDKNPGEVVFTKEVELKQTSFSHFGGAL
jgi:thiamine-monophosphate kinase